MPIVATGHEQHAGKVVGNGHCVLYLQIAGNVPHTSLWRRGELVRGGGFAPGTCIATFDRNGRYANATDGSSHAAILISQTESGLLVWDQWLGQPVHQRTLRFRGGQGPAVNDGDRFYTIELPPQTA